ncbi:DNA/RNA non-specific endonuclease [Streptomyces sp. NPDC058877]|uniref:DNA/RNA non-specific endonuclease n=1 Tax=Streptomyces sp. NPDC058877 TaxID=3346665 RepID=UPI0036B51E21
MGTDPGNPNSPNQDDQDPCKKPREERYHYFPLDSLQRSRGASVLMCGKQDLKPGPRINISSISVAGMPKPAENSIRPGFATYNKTHIVGDEFYGAARSENLFPGRDRMNKSGMRRCETKMKKELAAGNWVQYTGTLAYKGNNLIPTGIQMTAFTARGKLFDVRVENNQDWQTTC